MREENGDGSEEIRIRMLPRLEDRGDGAASNKGRMGVDGWIDGVVMGRRSGQLTWRPDVLRRHLGDAHP